MAFFPICSSLIAFENSLATRRILQASSCLKDTVILNNDCCSGAIFLHRHTDTGHQSLQGFGQAERQWRADKLLMINHAVFPPQITRDIQERFLDQPSLKRHFCSTCSLLLRVPSPLQIKKAAWPTVLHFQGMGGCCSSAILTWS